MAQTVVRSAKSGRFVDAKEAERNPDKTIRQKPVRLADHTVKKIAAMAKQQCAKDVEPAVILAVVRAYKRLAGE